MTTAAAQFSMVAAARGMLLVLQLQLEAAVLLSVCA